VKSTIWGSIFAFDAIDAPDRTLITIKANNNTATCHRRAKAPVITEECGRTTSIATMDKDHVVTPA